MYIFEKLCRLYEKDPFSLDGIIAKSLIEHFDSLERFSEIGFCKETGISKAGLHRFFSKAGFKSFKELCFSLAEDRYRNESLFPEAVIQSKVFEDKEFSNEISKANSIVLYGDLSHILYLSGFISCLRNKGKLVYILDYWDLQTSYKLLESMGSDCVFILFDFNTSTENFFEFSLIRSYMLDMDWISKRSFHKFHLSNVQKESYKGFIPISIAYNNGTDAQKLFEIDSYLNKMID